MNKRQMQESRIHCAATDLEIDPSETVTLDGQTFFLFSKRESGRVVSQCFARWGWSPSIVLKDDRLPKTGKGMQWLATDLAPSVSPIRALSVLYGTSQPADLDEAFAIVDWAQSNPQELTTGQAQRGLNQLLQWIGGCDA